MAKLPVNFDAASVSPNTAFDPVPAGWYNMHVTASEMKPTKDKDGSYLSLEHTILDGEFVGRKVFNNLNIVNKNATAQEIAYGTLSAICHAVGVIQLEDSSLLHGKPLQVKVKVEPATKDNEARNAVTGYKAIEGEINTPAWVEPAKATAPAPVSAPPAAPVVAPAPAQKEIVKTMTDAAKGVTYEAYVQAGWTDQQMIDNGILVITEKEVPNWSNNVPSQPSAPPAAPVASTPVASASPVKPPWEK